MSEFEWIPAIVRNVHVMSNPEGVPSPQKVWIQPLGRDVILGPDQRREREDCGCDWQHVKFFSIKGSIHIVCEHEVLTD
jgi:hypothetical protein